MEVEKSVGPAKRGAIVIVLSNTAVCRSDQPGIGQMTENGSFSESVTKAKPEKIAVCGVGVFEPVGFLGPSLKTPKWKKLH